MKTGIRKSQQVPQSRSATGEWRRGSSEQRQQRGAGALQRRVDESAAMQRQREQIEACRGQPLQRQGMEDEELLQGKFEALQRQPEEEELLQGKFEALQRQPEEEEMMQGKFAQPLQRETQDAAANATGMPDNLKAGVESLSGIDISDVRVHYNSARPAQFNAHAYAQGNDIHLGSGQEQHLPHEAWHTVQQRQGRVQPTLEMGGEKINDDAGLEREADEMGAKAMQYE